MCSNEASEKLVVQTVKFQKYGRSERFPKDSESLEKGLEVLYDRFSIFRTTVDFWRFLELRSFLQYSRRGCSFGISTSGH